MKWATQAMKDVRIKLLTFRAVGGIKKSRAFTKSWIKWQWTPPAQPRTAKTNVLWRGRGVGGEDKGLRKFCPGWSHHPRPPGPIIGPLVPVGATNRKKWMGQRTTAPPPAQLAIGPGTKALIGPRPNGGRDKCTETKAYYVVVPVFTSIWS